MKIIISLSMTVYILFNTAFANGGCETYSSVQIKNTFNANFLNRDMRGCFEYYFNNQTEKLESSTISIQIGKNLTNLDQANATKLSFAAFSFINNFYQVNKKLGNDTNQILDSIRFDAKKSSETITNDIKQTTELIQGEGLKQYQSNRSDLISDSIQFNAGLDQLNSSLKKEFPGAEISNDIGAKPLSIKASPIQKEKDKWINLKNNQQIPFHSLLKIKNKNVSDQILNEIKYARYIQSGKMPAEALPNLEKLQAIEKNGRLFDINYEKIRKNLDPNDSQFEPKNFALKASYQLKKISDQKLSNGELDKSSESIDMANLTLELATSLPVAATGRGLYEFFTGKNLLTGIELNNYERGASLAIALIDMTPSAWIAKGVKGAWIIGELGARLVEKGLVKIGFEDALKIGIENSQFVLDTFQNLLNKGSIKLETLKRIVEHKLFFNYLSEESYLASKAFEKDIISYEKTFSNISTEIGEKKITEILETPHGTRPLPETYLSTEYINSHLAKFDSGATRFIRQSQFEKFGLGNKDGVSFILSKNEADQLLKLSNGDFDVIEHVLALEPGTFKNEKILRIDISNPNQYNLRIPSGNEAGAKNIYWLPGGKLPYGLSEAIIDIQKIDPADLKIFNLN